MKTKQCRTRTLALEVRLRRVGFAVFEGQSRLLDWGIRRWRPGVDPVFATMHRTVPLLSLYAPSIVVLKHLNSSPKARRRKRVILSVKRQLVSRSVEVHSIGRAEVTQAFRQSGSNNKYQIAATIAERFPELRRKLPPKRKSYQPERYNEDLELNVPCTPQTSCAERSTYLDDAQQAALYAVIQQYQAEGSAGWQLLTPCSTFASAAWTAATSEYLSPDLGQYLWQTISDPLALRASIILANDGNLNGVLTPPPSPPTNSNFSPISAK